jgi:hypothetical protein
MKASNWIDRASLRCADWRFLLPNPPGGEFLHLVVLGGSADLAERLIAAGLAHHLSWEIPTRRMADGVVILHNVRTAQLGDIAGCLLPGGALYLEVDRRSLSSLTSTPGRLWRALVRVGLSPTGIYYVSPDFNHRQMYLPLDVPGAFKWYLRTQVVAGTLGRRVRELVLKMLARLRSLPLAALAPCYAVTAVAGPARDARPSVLGHPALPPEFRRSDLHPLVLTPGQSDSNRVVVLPFAPDSDQPVGVLKLSRLSDRNELTENEQLMLMTIRTRLDQAMRQTIPQPLGIFQWNHLSVGVERCASGCLLAASLGRWGAPLRRKIDDLHLATAWLAEFHCQTLIKRSAWGRAEVREWVETPLTAYTDAFDVTASEKRLFNWTQTRADSLVGIPLPTVWVHWGFNRQNLLRADDRISTIDWEGGSAGPPLFSASPDSRMDLAGARSPQSATRAWRAGREGTIRQSVHRLHCRAG